MGFQVYESPDVETDELNFGLLNVPPSHLARDMWDTFWISDEVLLPPLLWAGTSHSHPRFLFSFPSPASIEADMAASSAVVRAVGVADTVVGWRCAGRGWCIPSCCKTATTTLTSRAASHGQIQH
jgi:phenylalanyl-tRNA synthetase alpha subunit